MTDVFVRGIGVVGGFGSGMESLSIALERGATVPATVTVKMADREREMAVFLADTSRLEEFVPKRSLRRIDHYSRLALLGAHLALHDAGMSNLDPANLGIVVASGYGATRTTFAFLDSFIAGNDAYSSPTHFSGSVHNAAAAYISILLGARGPCLTISQFEMSVSSALITAIQWLREGVTEKVLFGAVDEYCHVLGYCWQRFFGDRTVGSIEPFLFHQQTAVPGEGTAFFLLSRERDSEKCYGRITGVEATWSATVEPPRPDGTLLIIGADGHKECCGNYEALAAGNMETAAYTPLFGSFPTNQAMDMAVALLSTKEGKVFAIPEGITRPPSLKTPKEKRDLDVSRICCLKLGPRGEAGMITIGPDSRTHDEP